MSGKYILAVFVIFVSISSNAQQDFNYTIFTRHRQLSLFKIDDSTLEELHANRSIVKVNTRIEIVDIQNTGSSYGFDISYQGIQYDTKDNKIYLVYSLKSYPWKDAKAEDLYMWVDPLTPLVEIKSFKDRNYVDKYY